MKKLLEKLSFNKDDIWYHGCSKSELLKKLNKPSCQHPLFLAKNVEYAAQYSKLTIDPKTKKTGQTPKKENDESTNYVYIITLNYSACNVFNPEQDQEKLDKLYNGNFSAVGELYGNNINSIAIFIADMFYTVQMNYNEGEEFIKEKFGNVIRNPSDSQLLKLIKSRKIIDIEKALIDDAIDNGIIEDMYDNCLYIGAYGVDAITYNQCLEFFVKFCQLHPQWTPNDDALQYILEDIQKVSNCNVVLTNEIMQLQSLNHDSAIESDAIIVIDVSALDSIYPKPLKISDINI